MRISILLAEDHIPFRQGLRALLETRADFEVIGEANNGREAVLLADMLQPAVLIIDVSMPEMDGLQATRQIKQQHPHIHIIVLSAYDLEAYVVSALHHGATAYVLKENSAQELIPAIRKVLTGNRYLSPALADRAIEVYASHGPPAPITPTRASVAPLTPREHEILQMLTEGLSNSEIGQRLLISPRTVEAHRANLKRKLGWPALKEPEPAAVPAPEN